MMNVHEIIRLLREHRDEYREFHVRTLYLFGSVVRGEDRPDSDVDILVEFEADAQVGLFTFARLQRQLSSTLGRRVDLVTPGALHAAIKDRILEEAVFAA